MADKPESELHDAASKLGREGGLAGGPARARALNAQERSDIAKKAAKARWAKERLKQSTNKQINKSNPHKKRLRRKKK